MVSALITTVRQPEPWRRDGCSTACHPRGHDPVAHESHGYWLGNREGYAVAVAELTPRVVRTGPLAVDLRARTVTVDGRDVALSPLEWGVLAYLAQKVGQHCEHDEIIAAVWGADAVDPARVWKRDTGYLARLDHRLLIVTVSRLREKLGDARTLLALSHSGYRLEQTP